MKNNPSPPNLEDIFERLELASGAKNDAAIGRALDASRQTVSTWRRRGTVPYEKLVVFAEKTNASLDYLLLGIERKPVSAKVDASLMAQIADGLQNAMRAAPDLISFAHRPSSVAYYSALIYEKVSDIQGDKELHAAIRREAMGLLKVMAREFVETNLHVENHPDWKSEIVKLKEFSRIMSSAELGDATASDSDKDSFKD